MTTIRHFIDLVESAGRESTEDSEVTRDELMARFPGIERDLAFVDDWMGNTEVTYRLTIVPMSHFEQRAKELAATYPEFPKDRERTSRIVRMLRNGAPVWPIFVDTEAASDEQAFIMEGRHRIVAFHILGLTKVPVVYVSKAG